MHGHRSGARSKAEIFVLEDERGAREMLSGVLTEAGYAVACFADSFAVLAAARARVPACLVLDVFVPGKSGLELLKVLHAEQFPAPILMISGLGSVAMAVSAIKHGAVDFIEKPLYALDIVARVQHAIETYGRRKAAGEAACEPVQFPGGKLLSRREREVVAQLVSGASTKEAARALGINPRTVEDHRSSIMKKLGARNSADLIRVVMSGAGHSAGGPAEKD
jgi:FixJ family two-component response regulator